MRLHMCGASGRLTAINDVMIFWHSGFSDNDEGKYYAAKQDSDHKEYGSVKRNLHKAHSVQKAHSCRKHTVYRECKCLVFSVDCMCFIKCSMHSTESVPFPPFYRMMGFLGIPM